MENSSLSLTSGGSKRLVIKSEQKRLVYGEVYSPLHVDTDNEAMTVDEIEKMAHGFLAAGRHDKIDVQHDKKKSGCLVVESFIARKNDPDGFVLGSWVVGAKIIPDEQWQKVLAGELNGFSFMGAVSRVPVKAIVKVAKKMLGETEMSTKGLLPPHFHEMSLDFNSSGRIVPGQLTDEAFGHKHEVNRATATEKKMEHSHRIILIENPES